VSAASNNKTEYRDTHQIRRQEKAERRERRKDERKK
jgi:hypothetical protein